MDIKILAKNNKLLLDAFINELQHFIDDDKQFHFDETLNEPRSLFIKTKVRKVRYESDVYPSKADEHYYIPDEWYEAIATIKKALDKQEQENYEEGEWVWLGHQELEKEPNENFQNALVKYTKDIYTLGFNYIGKWTNRFVFRNKDYGNTCKIKRKATQYEIKQALIEEAKRRDVWNKPIKAHADGRSDIVINDGDYDITYSLLEDKLWSKNGVVYYQGKWAVKAEESEVNLEKGKWYVEHTSTFGKWVFRYTKTESNKIYGSNSVFIDDSETTLDSSREVWLENIDRRCIRPATDEEVEQALRLIAKELGYKDGTKIRYSVFDISAEAYQLKEPFMLGYNYEAGYSLQDKKGLTFYADIEGWPEKAEFYEDEHQVEREMYVNGEKATFPCVIKKGDEILLKTKTKI